MSAPCNRSISLALLRAGLMLGFALATAGTVAAQQASGLTQYVASEKPPGFDRPAEASDAFKTALRNNDFDGLAKLLGLDPVKLRTSEGVMDTFDKMREGAAKRLTIEDKGNQNILELGDQMWPVPFPLVKGDDGKWAFDTNAGIEEIIARRIGENQSRAVETLRELVDGENAYALTDRNGDGVREYAQKLISTPGNTDGLYWPPDQGDGDSPAAAIPDAGQAAKVTAGEGYFGYRFRVLTGQGANVAGGKFDYVINGHMLAGFALLAYPVTYGQTGIDTFLVSKDSEVYQKDFGPDTAARAAAIGLFNPDDSWEIAGE